MTFIPIPTSWYDHLKLILKEGEYWIEKITDHSTWDIEEENEFHSKLISYQHALANGIEETVTKLRYGLIRAESKTFIKDLCQQINVVNENLNIYLLQQELASESLKIKLFYSEFDFKQKSDKYKYLIEIDNAQEEEMEFRRYIQAPINFPDSRSDSLQTLDIALMYFYNQKTITKPNKNPGHPTNVLALNNGYKNGENLYQVFNQIRSSSKILNNDHYSSDKIVDSIRKILPRLEDSTLAKEHIITLQKSK